MIIIIEPQCRGYQHEKCNSGAIALYLRAFPNDEVHFFAEKGHLQNVLSILELGDISLEKLIFHEIIIPDNVVLSRLSVIIDYFKLFNQVLGRGNFYDFNIKRIVLLSAYSFNLIAFKLFRARIIRDIEVDIFLHGAIESLSCEYNYSPLLLIKRAINFISNKFDFKLKFKTRSYNQIYDLLMKPAFYFFSNFKIKYILFREDSLLKFKSKLPFLGNNLLLVNLPNIAYAHLNRVDVPTFSCIYRSEEIKFEYLFNSLKSIKLNNVHCFNVFLSSPINLKLDKVVSFNIKVHYPKNRSRLEIDNFIKHSKYMIYLYPDDSYELTTSGAFFDAIMHNKPVLFLRNHCFDYYFEKFKFGYRFDNISELKEKIVEIICYGDAEYDYFLEEIDKLKYFVSTENNFNKLIYEEI